MNTVRESWSTPELAAWLGTSIHRIHRAAVAAHLKPSRTSQGHLRFSGEDAITLLHLLGRTPSRDDFTREEFFVLAALWRRPFGLRSARLVARAARVSTATAVKALSALDRQGFVEHRSVWVSEAVATLVTVWVIRLDPFPFTDDLARSLSSTVLPSTRPAPAQTRVPARFKTVFWNSDLRRLTVEANANVICQSILEQSNVDALGWAIQVLPKSAFETLAGRQRGTTPKLRRLAADIAASL